MEYLILVLSAFLISSLTLFSGFGLGTMLMPVFAVFFPLETAIAVTAVVHLLNNLFKLVLLRKYVDLKAALKFGLPAVPAAILGAYALTWLSKVDPVFSYSIAGESFEVTPVKLVISILILLFALLEFLPERSSFSFDQKYMPLGGILSGFFGGLSGHQGAFRSAFLLRSGLGKEEFISTGVIVAILVDVPRISVYLSQMAVLQTNIPILITAVAAAFSGSFIASNFIRKIQMRSIRIIVAVLLFGIAVGLGAGII